MPDRHPDAETLTRYLSGQSADDEREHVERHLAGCSACRRRLQSAAGEGAGAGYGAAVRRAVERAEERLPGLLREIEAATAGLAELLGLPPDEREPALAEPRFHLLKLADLLEEAAREAWTRDPRLAVELAGLAVTIADHLDPAHYGTWLVEDARALARAHLGNALRVASDLRRAEEELEVAWAHHRQGDTDAYTEALLLSFTASLRNSQGRYDDAVVLLDRAISIYRQTKDRQLEGRTLILRGMAFGYSGRTGQALRSIRAGSSKVDYREDPRLLVSAEHNLIWYLNESGAHQQAQRELRTMRRVYLDFGDPLHLVRLRWLDGKIAAGLGELDEAVIALTDARAAFIEQSLGFDAALVALDLTAVYLRQRRTAEVKRLAAEMVPIFESRDVHQEALAALLVFREAAEAERVTASLVERLATFLTRARRNPELRFDAEG